VNVLTGAQEAFLLRSALDLGPHTAVGCEVGGGSVQVVDADGLMLSVPCGTVTLSRKFGLWLEADEEPPVLDYVAQLMARPLAGITSKRLIVGTSKMATFFRCLRKFGGAERVLDASDRVAAASADTADMIRPIELDLVLSLIRKARPEDFQRIMPTDPNFMFGGHKLLLVILTIARLLHSQELYGSDVSTAQILAGQIDNRPGPVELASLRPFTFN
jgi:hypothetical protein